MHLGRRPFEKAAAPAGKQGVPAKKTALAIKGQMPAGMPGHSNDLKLGFEFGKVNDLSTSQGVRHPCDRLALRAIDGNSASAARQQFGNAALMVSVFVRDQDGGQMQAFAVEKSLDLLGLSRIDHNGKPAFAQQPDVVILERRNRNNFEHGGILEERPQKSIAGLDDWLTSPQGRYVMAWEQEKSASVVADLFGYHALQLGMPQFDLLANSRIPLRQTAGGWGNVNVLCDLRELPFAANSIDLVVMPHALEFHNDPHQILREVERILIPDGQLVVTGFNPLSLWGLRRRLPPRHPAFPGDGQYISVLRLKDWLKLLSFEVDRGNFGCYVPPCDQERWLKRWQFMEAAGDRWWSFAGGVYLLRAVKRVHGMRLIMPRWPKQKVSRKALGSVAQKETESV